MMIMQFASGLFGGQKKPNFQKILRRNQGLFQQQLGYGVQNLNQYGGQFMDAYSQMSPMFGQLAAGASQMFGDDNRRFQLAQDMAKFTRGGQAQRGILRSPAAALKESFAGLQFQEQMRQQDFGNLMAVEQASPARNIFAMMTQGIRGDLGFQEMAARRQVSQSNRANMMNAISGMGNTYMQGQGLAQGNRYLDILSGMGQQQAAASGGGYAPQGSINQMSQNMPWNQTNPFSSQYP
jgi:hypothetical protein